MLQATVGLIGDLVSSFGEEVIALCLDTSILSLIQVALTSDEKTRDIAMTTSALISNSVSLFQKPHFQEFQQDTS